VIASFPQKCSQSSIYPFLQHEWHPPKFQKKWDIGRLQR
jgi:hypothetical protein